MQVLPAWALFLIAITEYSQMISICFVSEIFINQAIEAPIKRAFTLSLQPTPGRVFAGLQV
ncbi:hypothetical protein APV28_0883 [Comamonas testosteroni]|nr:hypothetical protein APV28_0883 [Comamonas testosteroni]